MYVFVQKSNRMVIKIQQKYFLRINIAINVFPVISEALISKFYGEHAPEPP